MPEQEESSSSEEEAPRREVRESIVDRAVRKAALKGKLEPELWTKTFWFRLYLAVIGIVNVQVMALETDFGCHTNHCPEPLIGIWTVMEQILTGFFVLDVAARIWEAKPRRFFKGDETKEKYKLDVVNLFDFVIVVLRAFDLWLLTPLGRTESGLKFPSVFRIMHISTFVHEIQLWKGFRELWIVISLLRETLLTLFWCGFLIVGTTWVISVLITISVLTDPKLDFDLSRSVWTKEDYWGSVGRTVITMFQVLLRDKWADSIVWPMVQNDPIVMLIFAVFYCVVVLALMNNVTGVVVECAMEASTLCGELYQKEQGPSLYSGVFCSVAMHGRRRSWTCLVALALFGLGVGRSFAGGRMPLRTARTCLEHGPPRDSGDELGDRKLRFGKHKGKSFREVAKNKYYVNWCKQKLSREDELYKDWLDYVAGKRSASVRSSQKAQPRSVEAPPASSVSALPSRTASLQSPSEEARLQSRAAPGAPATSGRRQSARPRPSQAPLQVKGPNSDIFELPRGLLEGYQLWSCKGKAEPPDGKTPWAFSYHDGWTYVGRVRLGRKLVLNLKEGRNDMAAARKVNHQGARFEALPKYHFRGIVPFGGKAHIAASLDQELYAPEERNLGGQGRTAMASLVGLKVRPLGPAQSWFTGLVICEPEDRNNITLTPSIQQNLLQMTKTPKVYDATAKALVDELLLTVSKNCTNERDLKMTFVANALRPSVTGQAQEQKLRGLKGWERFHALPPTKIILDAATRQRMIAEEVTRLSDKIFKWSPLRPLRVQDGSPFQKLEPPMLVVGNKKSISGAERPSKVLFNLDRAGSFKVKPSTPLRLGAATFRANPSQQDFVETVLNEVRRLLEKYGIRVADTLAPIHKSGSLEKDVQSALRSEALTHADAVLLFGGKMNDAMYNQAKYECLRSQNDAGKHVTTQWFDLGKSNVWSPKSKTLEWAEKICAVGIIAKLGHAPWAINVRPWFRAAPKDIRVGVVGYDVCHLRNPKNFKKPISIAAAIRVDSEKDEDPWLLSHVTFRTERVQVETVPSQSLKEMIPADFARGRLIIIHRDGEFPKAELASLRAYHEELAASEGGSQTTFVLVECVKWAGGSPRLYEGTKSAPAGAMLALSDKEALLASSKDIFQGTANPISLRLAGVLGDVAHSQFAMDKFAWVQSVFDLSYLHHGSVLKRPRLPITTHFADRLAYMLSALGKDGGEWESVLADNCSG
ncbi:unnamed protein product [Symbiodinium necroappetens]|uniref:Piwi domain-containing protein n=1 Tax=Symbiodinium necroappetens TaxID=1628268 RepID=A0A812IYE5_9DINO|nr:unnamed protein product [Symbiodinium necroappetens]